MGTKIKYKTIKNEFPQMKTTIEALGKRSIEIGAIEGEHKWLAGIHEYGLDIEVTPKMRAFLHYQGLHLKASTTHIKIPERSFLRSSHDEHAKDVLEQSERALGLVLSGKMRLEEYMDMVGRDYVGMVKDYIVELDKPSNHPYTVEQKGDDNPLIGKTNGLIESISYRVK